jgi:carbamoyltransferase
MIICGLKLTHDGSVALIKDGKLVFNVELEKLNNNPRYTGIDDTYIITEILNENGFDISDVDHFAVDGWGGDDQDELAIQPRLEIGEQNNKLSAFNKNETYKMDIALYEEKTLKSNVLEGRKFSGLKIGNANLEYYSYLHVAGHIMSAYSSSVFSKKGESSYILVWDGGMYPRLYYFNAELKNVENLGPIFLFIGNMYTIFSQHFGPFKVSGNFAKDNLSIAGKVMAYIALGKVRRELFEHFDKIYTEFYTTPMGFANIFANEFKKKIEGQGYSDEDILTSFHIYLEEMIVEKLVKKIRRHDKKCGNLCIAGGCALNIKWNSAIRTSGMFNEVYVPPFPNDSGSAIGNACCTMLDKMRISFLDWDVYSGPKIKKNKPSEGWTSREFSIEDLARLLYENDEPVVFLNGNSELGPRALGNRSIIAPATKVKMKDVLNMIKKREYYRPVSPICLEERAREVFDPGIPDPYMLFDHKVRENWEGKIPAVCHLDKTARLQTVKTEQNKVVAELLAEYERLSGIPLLCNTSANFKGSGFFPDISSAANWNMANYIWCDNVLYEKKDKLKFI